MRGEEDLLVECRIADQWHRRQFDDGVSRPCTPSWANRCGFFIFRKGLASKPGSYIDKLGVLLVTFALDLGFATTFTMWLGFIWGTLVGVFEGELQMNRTAFYSAPATSLAPFASASDTDHCFIVMKREMSSRGLNEMEIGSLAVGRYLTNHICRSPKAEALFACTSPLTWMYTAKI